MSGLNGSSSYFLSDFSEIPQVTAVPPYSREVEMPEWTPPAELAKGRVVKIIARPMSEHERLRFLRRGNPPLQDLPREEYLSELREREDWFSSGERDIVLLQQTYVKPSGGPLFTYNQAREIFERPDPRPWIRMVTVAEEISLITNTSLEDFRKNLTAPRTGISESLKPLEVQTPE